MSIFTAIANLFSSKKKKEEKIWAELNYGKPAQPKNLTPLDPEDPWKT